MLSELPEGWEVCRLADVAEIRIGGTPSRSNDAFWDKTGNGEAWVSIADLKQPIVTRTKETITPLGVEKSNVKHVLAGTILMSFKLTVGRVALAGRDLYTNEAIAAFSLSKGVERDYLYQYLPSFVDMVETEQAVKGKTLNKKSLAEIPIVLPPLNEQHRIAEILSSVDESIQATQAVIEQVERVKRGLMEELLTGGLGSEAIERGEVPERWQKKQVEDVCEILDKFRVPLNSQERSSRKGTIPYWGANGIVDYIDEAIFDEPLLLMPEDGGAFSESYNKPICFKIDEPVWVNNHAHILRVTRANREYIYQWFVNRDITDFVVGGTRAKLNQKALRSLPVFLPPPNEQNRIAEILSSVDESIASHKANIEQQSRVKKGLMDDLLTGKVRTV